MRAVRCTAPGTVEVVDTDDVVGADAEVVVHVRSAGICGSDLHLLGWGPMPFTFGHEIGGVLDDGTPVAVRPMLGCGTCDRCGAGEAAQCRIGAGRVLGIGRHGGMADRLVVEASAAVPLPDGVRPDVACLVEPVACALHAVRRAGVTAGDRVVVVGAGAIGLGAAAAARWLGASVDVAARHAAQRDAATAIGCGAEPAGEYDLAVDAAGTSSSIARCVELLRPGGTVAYVATAWDAIELPALFSSKEPTIVTASMQGDGHGEPGRSDMETAAQVVADVPELSRMITHRLPLDRAPEAFALAADRAAGAVKVVLEP